MKSWALSNLMSLARSPPGNTQDASQTKKSDIISANHLDQMRPSTAMSKM